ncbi:MAG: YihY/virulence factor BrkB family protein [Desulfuromonas sp.]|nr:YihY/virulence factor BrkB family protein [Desulfuromonas sp.]
MGRLFEQVDQWLKTNLWDDKRLQRGANWLRVPLAAVLGYNRNQCGQKAAALTFSTLLAFIPLLAIMFALLKGLGVHNKVEPLLLKHISVGSEEVVARIIEYINNTNVARLGSVGLVMLVFTVLMLISNIEKSFNSLWRVNETRTLFRRFADYFSVVTLGPLFLLAAISLNTSMRNQQVVQWILDKPVFGDLLLLLFEVLPFVVIWAAFIFLYMFVPNTKVNIFSGLVGGICGGTLWLITQWGYVNFQYGVGKYNAIYGTMAALPIFMIWIYVSWMIVLFGLQLCWAHQNRLRLGFILWQQKKIAWQPLQVLELLLLVYNRFQQAQPCWKLDEIIDQTEIPADTVHTVLEYLQQRGVLLLVSQGTSEEILVVPQLPAQALELPALLTATIDTEHVPDEVAIVAAQLQQIRQQYIGALDLDKMLQTAAAQKH